MRPADEFAALVLTWAKAVREIAFEIPAPSLQVPRLILLSIHVEREAHALLAKLKAQREGEQ